MQIFICFSLFYCLMPIAQLKAAQKLQQQKQQLQINGALTDHGNAWTIARVVVISWAAFEVVIAVVVAVASGNQSPSVARFQIDQKSRNAKRKRRAWLHFRAKFQVFLRLVSQSWSRRRRRKPQRPKWPWDALQREPIDLAIMPCRGSLRRVGFRIGAKLNISLCFL